MRALLDIGRLGEAIGRRSAYWTPQSGYWLYARINALG